MVNGSARNIMTKFKLDIPTMMGTNWAGTDFGHCTVELCVRFPVLFSFILLLYIMLFGIYTMKYYPEPL